MNIIAHKKIFITIGLLFVAASVSLILIFGFNPSIDFQGGSIYEVEYQAQRPDISSLEQVITPVLPNSVIQHTAQQGVLIKAVEISEEQKNSIDQQLSSLGEFEEIRFRELGAAFSQELLNKSIFAIIFVITIIVAFIAYTFRGVSHTVASWKYGVIAIVALIHDTVIPVGIFALLGSLFIEFQIDILFVTAILATLGYSVNDTIVIFDRVRENLTKHQNEDKTKLTGDTFAKVVQLSLNESMRRSLFTSATTLLALITLYTVGSEVTQPFALVLAIGVVAGTYSSLFIACPLLVYLEEWSASKKANEEEPDTKQDSDEADEDLPEDIKRFLEKQQRDK